MRFKTIITVVLAGFSMIVTLILGTVAWINEGRVFWDAVYSASLAFVGDEIYLKPPVPENTVLRVVRFSGLFTTAAAIIAVVLGFVTDRWQFFRSRFLRRKHIVLVGGGQFALDRYEEISLENRCSLTFLGETESEQTLAPRRASTLLLPVDPNDPVSVNRNLGRHPRLIVLGDKNAPKNLERARNLKHSGNLAIRIEDGSIARDLDFLMPELAKAEVFSLSQITARALVTRMAPADLALLRQQERVHIGLIGFGSLGLAIAEELILRCYTQHFGELKLSVFDKNPDQAENQLKSERFGLANLEIIQFFAMDGLQCGQADGLKPLCEAENHVPFTAVIVATGDDARNTAIGMRLRQGQRERLCIKAPIFVHQDARSAVRGALFEDLTGGLTVFGGRMSADAGHGIEVFRESLAEALHEMWLQKSSVEEKKNSTWSKLTFAQRRSSYRAALSAIELLRSCGLTPDTGSGIAGMRVPHVLVKSLLNDPELVDKLVRNEHTRWMVEKISDGYVKPEKNLRDDEKKLHPLLIPFDELSKEDQQKDRDIVLGILGKCADRFEKNPKGPAWREVLRVGLFGPLGYDPKGIDELTNAFKAFIGNLPRPLHTYTLEIVTPNAPGFDRVGAAALAKYWRKKTKRSAGVVAIQAASESALNRLASKQVPIAAADAQSVALRRSIDFGVRIIDRRPVGVSDADLIHEPESFFETVKVVGSHINSVCDLTIAAVDEESNTHTNKALAERKKSGRPFIELRR